MPKYLDDARMVYVRTTDVSRVIQSVQQILHGLYPPGTNLSGPWRISMRSRGEETLWPNRRSCRRLAELVGQFSRAAREKWDGSEEVRYLDERLGKWMPEGRRLGLDSKPSLLGVLDMINSTAASGDGTRLPGEFYEEKVRGLVERVVGDEWFGAYGRSRELRMLGAGLLVGGMVVKMVDQVEWDRGVEVRESPPPRLSLIGCHDRTIGIVLASIGCWGGNEKWPGFTSHVIFELFRKGGIQSSTPREVPREEVQDHDDYFVRVKYNNRVMTVHGCQAEGSHFDGDLSLCTLVRLFPPEHP